jgi:transposase InsO family protein
MIASGTSVALSGSLGPRQSCKMPSHYSTATTIYTEDVTEPIGPGLYQYTAIDDCTRIRVLALFNRRTAANSVQFLELAIEEFPFPIQRIQTDRGREFFAYCFQEKLMEYGIKCRPIKPASPHLNGKVERSQRTDIEEFYATVNLKARICPSICSTGRITTTNIALTGPWAAERRGRSGTNAVR